MRRNDVQVSRVARAGALLLAVVAVVVAAVFGLLRWLSVPPDTDPARLPYTLQLDGPRLQSAPQMDEARYREEKARALGERLPLESSFTDSDGRRVQLSSYFGDGRPVVLVLGYYRCPQLCGLVMHGLLEALHDDGIERGEVRILGMSVDPGDTPTTARARYAIDQAYAELLEPGVPLDLHLLSGDAHALAQRAGFGFQRDVASADTRYVHDTGVVVLTPQGRISHQLAGVRFERGELRRAVDAAREERIGSIGERLALLCAHFDPRLGAHSAAVMNAVRVSLVLLAVALGSWLWRRR